MTPLSANSQALVTNAGTLARVVQLGGPQSAGLADPLAILWSPAALAALRDSQFQLSAEDAYSLSFLGATSHIPLIGTFAMGVSRLPGDSSSQKRISLGWAKHVGRRMSAGFSLHGSRLSGENFFTGTIGLQLHSRVPGALGDNFPTTGALFNLTALPYRYALGFHLQEIRFGRKAFATTYNLGAAARFGKAGPSFFASIDFREDDNIPHVGVSVPIFSRLMLNAGITNFKADRAAIGATILASNHNLDVAYSFDNDKLLVAFGFRLSAPPAAIARSHLEQGSVLAKRGEYRKALIAMRRYLVFEPDNAPTLQITKLLSDRIQNEDHQIVALMRQADQFEKKSWYISATLNYLKVLQLDKSHARARQRLLVIEPKVDIYINQMFRLGVQAFEQGNIAAARKAFENILLVRKDHAEAQSHLQRIVDMHNKEAEESFLRGLGYYSQKNYVKSIEAFQQALSLNADYADAQQYLDKAQKEMAGQASEVTRLIAEGERLARRQEFIAAYQRYQQALSLDPTNQIAIEQARRLEDRVKVYVADKLQIGEQAYQRGNYDQAAEVFRQVLATSPREETAKSYLQRIEQQNRQRADEFYRRGLEYFAAKDYNRALTSFEEALALDANHALSLQKKRETLSQIGIVQLLERGKAFYQQNQFMQAMEIFNQVLEQDPGNTASQRYIEDCQNQLNLQVEKYFNQGMNYYAAEDYREAIKMWDRVLQINPNHTQSRTYKRQALDRLQALEQLP